MVTTENPSNRRLPVDRAARVAVPAGMAVVTWLVVLLGAGLVLRPGALLAAAIPLVVVGVMLWPLVAVAPWRNGVTGRVRGWAARQRSSLLVTAGLAAVLAVPFVADLLPGVLVGILRLPFRATGMLFGASVFYRERVGAFAGRTLLRFGQWYLEVLWLYVIASGITMLSESLRPGGT